MVVVVFVGKKAPSARNHAPKQTDSLQQQQMNSPGSESVKGEMCIVLGRGWRDRDMRGVVKDMGEGVAKGGLACSYGYLGPTLTFSSSKALSRLLSPRPSKDEKAREARTVRLCLASNRCLIIYPHHE